MDDLRIGDYTIPDSEIEEIFTTSSGPGGQHANRSHTAVEVRFDLAESEAFPPEIRERIASRLGWQVSATASESRSQWRNRAAARRRLAAALEEAMRPERRRRPTRPTAASRRNRLDAKRRQSEKKRLRRKPEI